ncbi:Hypothetical protein CINCED_3A023648 [Cinara cedri]|uniref:Reverse transcriptase domain n=1 Tax=Cinara cedri TaxID=506608 RepID=A0A5E4N8G5_9HEMI|nr:Hypothetical protein CINCED_3A023648 [Cinara cedri]
MRTYKHLNKKLNKYAKETREKWLEDKFKEVDLIIKRNIMNQTFDTIKKFAIEKQKLIGDEITSPNDENNPDMQGVIILREDFNRVLKTMKTRKALGVDEITSELIQIAGTRIQDKLFKLVYGIYITGEIPENFNKNIIITPPKNSTAEKYNEYRTLSIMVHSAKILVKIIIN